MEQQRKRLIWRLRNGKGEMKGTGGKDQKEKRAFKLESSLWFLLNWEVTEFLH